MAPAGRTIPASPSASPGASRCGSASGIENSLSRAVRNPRITASSWSDAVPPTRSAPGVESVMALLSGGPVGAGACATRPRRSKAQDESGCRPGRCARYHPLARSAPETFARRLRSAKSAAKVRARAWMRAASRSRGDTPRERERAQQRVVLDRVEHRRERGMPDTEVGLRALLFDLSTAQARDLREVTGAHERGDIPRERGRLVEGHDVLGRLDEVAQRAGT